MTNEQKFSAKYNLNDDNLKEKIIKDFKATHKTLKEGNDVDGYTALSAEEYELKLDSWADNIIAELESEAEIQFTLTAKATAQAKLEALGLTVEDLTALGL